MEYLSIGHDHDRLNLLEDAFLALAELTRQHFAVAERDLEVLVLRGEKPSVKVSGLIAQVQSGPNGAIS